MGVLVHVWVRVCFGACVGACVSVSEGVSEDAWIKVCVDWSLWGIGLCVSFKRCMRDYFYVYECMNVFTNLLTLLVVRSVDDSLHPAVGLHRGPDP